MNDLDEWGQMTYGTDLALRFNHLCKAWHEQQFSTLSSLISLSTSLIISIYISIGHHDHPNNTSLGV